MGEAVIVGEAVARQWQSAKKWRGSNSRQGSGKALIVSKAATGDKAGADDKAGTVDKAGQVAQQWYVRGKAVVGERCHSQQRRAISAGELFGVAAGPCAMAKQFIAACVGVPTAYVWLCIHI
eukprot:1158007-Pelagomonas_calceolata.AAC.8